MDLSDRPAEGAWIVTLSDTFTTDTWTEVTREQAEQIWRLLGGTGTEGTGIRTHYRFNREEFADMPQAHGNAGLVAEHPDDSMDVRFD